MNGEPPNLRKSRVRWTPEADAELRRQLIPWAEKKTRTEGRFSITQAAEELLDSANKEPVAKVVHALEEEGRVEPYGRLGFRFVGVEAASVTRSSEPYKWTDEKIDEMRDELRTWAQERTREQGHFNREEAVNAFQIPLDRVKDLLGDLREAEDVERLPGALGYRATDVDGPEVDAERGPLKWTAERLKKLAGKIEPWAKEQTREKGSFSIAAAVRKFLDSSNREPVRDIVHGWQEDEKVVFLSCRRGWAWKGVPRPDEPELENTPIRWTEEKRDDLRDDLVAYATEQTRRRGRFTVTRAADELLEVANKEPITELVGELEDEGKVASLGQRFGFAMLGVVPEAVTLAGLLALARTHTDEDKSSNRRGRSSFEDRLKLETLTASQMKDIETGAGLVADYAGDGDPGAVGMEFFEWDSTAGTEGRGDWAILDRVAQWSDDRSRRRAEARGETWSRKKGASSRYKAVGAIKNLLDLAANHGVIERSERFAAEFETYAGEWAPEVERWVEEVVERNDGTAPRKIRKGVRILALYASRRNELSWEAADWDAVRADIEAAHESGELSQQQRDAARYVWRRTPELQEARPWETIRDKRTGLVPNSAITAVVEERDFSGWVDDSGESLSELIDGEFGLRGWVDWATLPPEELDLRGLPARAWPRPTENQSNLMEEWRRKNDDAFQCAQSTLRSRLGKLNLLLGWATERGKFDGRHQGLDALCDPALMAEYSRWRAGQTGSGGYDPEAEAERTLGRARLALALARVASPYLEAVALQHGDTDRADALQEKARRLKTYGYRQKSLENECKDIQDIYAAWSAGGRDGYRKLIDFCNLLIAEAEEEAGLSLEDSVEAIEKGDYRPTLSWAVAIRGAVLVNFLRKVPLRARTTSLLTLTDWQNLATRPGEFGRALREWEGAIHLQIAPSKMKNRRKFEPAYMQEEHVGDPHKEEMLCRPLLRAYFMDDGARDRLLEMGDGRKTSPYVFPACASKGRGKDGQDREEGERWQPPSISAWFRNNVASRAEKLQLDLRRLEQQYGSLGLHVIRLLYGSYFVKNDPVRTSLMLSHSSVDFTVKLYSGLTEKQSSMEVRPPGAGGRAEVDRKQADARSRTEREATLLREKRAYQQRVAELERLLKQQGLEVPKGEHVAEAA